jgi:hypothetical protein
VLFLFFLFTPFRWHPDHVPGQSELSIGIKARPYILTPFVRNLHKLEWKSPRGGELAKPEIYKLKLALRSGLALELNGSLKDSSSFLELLNQCGWRLWANSNQYEQGNFRERKQIKWESTSEHDDLFYRGLVPKNIVSVEEATKARSIPTLSLSKLVT